MTEQPTIEWTELAHRVNDGIDVDEPKMPTFALTVANVKARLLVEPGAVASPLAVKVWSPVLVP